jgi:hypothetical protein
MYIFKITSGSKMGTLSLVLEFSFREGDYRQTVGVFSGIQTMKKKRKMECE